MTLQCITLCYSQDDKTLDTTLEECSKEMEILSTKVSANESRLYELSGKLEQLKTKEQEKHQKIEEIPSAIWQRVM